MTSDFPVVLDACVLVQAAVRDTLLRLAEQRLFLCRWSDEIMEEMARTLRDRLNLSVVNVEYFLSELRDNFPDAWVESGYRELIPAMKNDAKDRHVLAAAVKSGRGGWLRETIVTYNLKHFPETALEPFDIVAQHPDDFLISMYDLDPELVMQTLHEQGAALRTPRSVGEVLRSLEGCECRKFSKLVSKRLRAQGA